MDYVKPFTYFVAGRNGLGNLVQCAVCVLIPVVGPIVLLGYRAEVADELVRSRRMTRHPDFEFGRFGDYLSRGVWPFVYQLVVVLLLAGLLFGCVLVGIAVGAAVREPLLGLAAGLLLAVPVLVGTPALVWPLELHAQLSGRFAPVEAFGFAARFLGRVWGQLLVSLLLFGVASFVLNLAGFLMLIVGIYLTTVIQFMAQQHLMTQLYVLYLDDGGEPIAGPDDEYDEEDEYYEEPRRRRGR